MNAKPETVAAVTLPHPAKAGSLCREGRLRRAGKHSGESDGRVARNGMNPRVGSGLQHVRSVRKEQAVEVEENHEDGTSTGGGTPGPKGSAPGNRRWHPGVDSRTGKTTEGRIFGQHKRGSGQRELSAAGPARNRQGWRQGQEGRQNGSKSPRCSGMMQCPRRRVPGAHVPFEHGSLRVTSFEQACRKGPIVMEGRGEGQTSLTIISCTPLRPYGLQAWRCVLQGC